MALVSPSQWHEGGRYFEYRNHQIFYRMAGHGVPLVLIHGFPTSSWDWYKVWDLLTDHYQVIAFDMVGFGFSDKPRRYQYSIHDQADLFEALMTHLGISACHLLVHDYGNTVAQEILARNHRSMTEIRSVCFLNGGLFPEMHRALLIQKLLKSPLGFLVTMLNSKTRLRKSMDVLYGRVKADGEELEGYWQIICRQNGHRLLHKLIHYIHDRRQHRGRWVGILQATTVPLRLINGPDDPVSGRHLAEYYQQMIPNPDVVLIEGVGHYPQTEAPNEVLKHYFEFRNSHS